VKLAIGACQKIISTLTFFTFHIFHLVWKKVKQQQLMLPCWRKVISDVKFQKRWCVLLITKKT